MNFKKTAIMIDGGFYLKKTYAMNSQLTGKEAAKRLIKYCYKHLNYQTKYEKTHDIKSQRTAENLYRIFYYDAPLLDQQVFHPLTRKDISLAKTDFYTWKKDFLKALLDNRKIAFRLGELSSYETGYSLKPKTLKKLFNPVSGLKIEDITENDFKLNINQKAVDMKIGIDIATLSYKKLVDQIVLIAGDCDFAPVAKLARIEGIDFILDPMGNKVTDSLFKHVDMIRTFAKKLQ